MGELLTTRNPRTGTEGPAVPATSPNQLVATAAALRAAQPGWADAGVGARCDALQQWAAAIEAARPALVAALVEDTGRIAESELEVTAVVGAMRRWAGSTPTLLVSEPARPSVVPGFELQQSWDPYPVVGVISPWNFPLLLAMIDAMPALAAGTSVVVKPSELTPRFVPVLRETVRLVPELEPVVALVTGGADLGRAIVDSVDAVCFTGSVATGRAVAVAAAQRLIPAYLELGGKDPAVVTATADVTRTARALLWGATANAGQSCLSIERVYAVDAVYERLVEELVGLADRVPLAVPGPGDGLLGPIIAPRQVEVITRHLDDAVARGATIRCGGRFEEHGGSYLPVTVLTDVDHTMAVMTEETFGPLIPVMRAADVEEAVALANDSDYGLSGAVFAGDVDEAEAVGARLRVGAVSCNDAALTAIIHDGEKQSYASSGVGPTRMGLAAIHRFHRRRVAIRKLTDADDPWWYPLR